LKALDTLLQCQTVFIKVLQIPDNCKLMEVLESISSHLYSLSNKAFEKDIGKILEIVENDLHIMSNLKKQFNPSIT